LVRQRGDRKANPIQSFIPTLKKETTYSFLKDFMKKTFGILGFLGLLVGLAYQFWPVSTSAPWPKGNPAHPGWLEQWRAMRVDANGQISMDRFRQIRDQIHALRTVKSDGGLSQLREVGPDDVGGRIRGFIIDRTDTNHYLAGGISGGLWRSTNRGGSWTPVDDNAQNLSVTWIEQNPFFPNVMYYASGEPSGNSAGIPGDGIFKSTDGGANWQQLAATDNNNFLYSWRVRCSPVDTNTLYVATSSRGLWRSTDAGNSFQQVYSNANITDLELTPDGKVWIGVRSLGVYSSATGDQGTFTTAGAGLPTSGFRRIEMAFSPSDSLKAYVIYETTSGSDCFGFYATEDGGQTWTERQNPTNYGIQFDFPWYCLALEVSPQDPNYVLVGSVNAGFTTNGGQSFSTMANSHADYHHFVFIPGGQEAFISANDGGLYRYRRQTAVNGFMSLNNGLNITQFYAGTYFPTGDDYIGGTQDNGTRQRFQTGQNGARRIYGGDGAFCHVNPQMPTTAYASSQNANLVRTDNVNSTSPQFYRILNGLDLDGDDRIDDPVWFINPFEINVLDGNQVYLVTKRRIYATFSGGSSWIPLSNTYVDLYALGVSKDEAPTLYFASTGRMYRIDDALAAFPGSEVNISSSIPPSLNASFISHLAVSPRDKGTVYVTYSSYDALPSVWKVTGANTANPVWTNIHGDLPPDLPVNGLVVSPFSEDVLVIGSDFGLFVTEDGGQHWTLVSQMPFVSVHQLRLREDGQLYIFTHGRGVWMATIPLTGLGNATESSNAQGQDQAFWFPNPVVSGGTLTAKSPVQSITVLGPQGQNMGHWEGLEKASFIVPNWPSGIYTLVAKRSSGEKMVHRLVLTNP